MSNESTETLIMELISWREGLCSMGYWALGQDDMFLQILCKLAEVDSQSELVRYFFEVLRSDYNLIFNLQQKLEESGKQKEE